MSSLRSRRKRLKRFLVYGIARLIILLVALLPPGVAVALGAMVGRLAFILAARDRRRAIEQLSEALALDDPSARSLARRVFANVGRVAAEIAILPRLVRELPTYVELPEEDRALLAGALAAERGVVFVSAHLGSWELLAQRVAAEGFDCVTLARPNPNPYLGAWLVARRGRVETINRGDPRAARRMLGALRRGAIVGVLLDQDTRVESVHVPFFGRPAKTPTAAAELAVRGDIPVIAGFIERKEGGRGHRVRLERIALEVDPERARSENVRAATAAITLAIERAVRRRPEEWVWFHDRWRSEPAR